MGVSTLCGCISTRWACLLSVGASLWVCLLSVGASLLGSCVFLSVDASLLCGCVCFLWVPLYSMGVSAFCGCIFTWWVCLLSVGVSTLSGCHSTRRACLLSVAAPLLCGFVSALQVSCICGCHTIKLTDHKSGLIFLDSLSPFRHTFEETPGERSAYGWRMFSHIKLKFIIDRGHWTAPHMSTMLDAGLFRKLIQKYDRN